MIKPWHWIDRSLPPGPATPKGTWTLVDGSGRECASIWQNDVDRFTWHTWDICGVGGENSEASSLDDAKRHCVAAIVRQGWAPGGWRVRW